MLEETWSKKQQDRSSCWLLFLFTLNIIPYSYSNPAEYYYILWTLLYSYTCGSQVKAQPSSGHKFHARSCVRRDYPSEVMEIVSYCTKSGRMSRKLVSGKYVSITKQCLTTLTTFKILDITWAVGHFLTCTWVCIDLDGSTCSECLSVVTCDFEPPEHATDLVQGPHLRRGVRAGSLRAPEPRAREKTCGRKRKKCPCAEKHIRT